MLQKYNTMKQNMTLLKCGDELVSKPPQRTTMVTATDSNPEDRDHIAINGMRINNENLFNNYTVPDGTPIGKEK